VSVGGERPLWAGRFSEPPAPEAAALGRSLGFDVRLAEQDVRAGIAHVHALARAGLLTAEEAEALAAALAEVRGEIAEGRFAFHPADEDVHSAIERGVTERLGELGAKLHAARSRNDLVMTDLRLWMLGAEARLREGLERLVRALLGHARAHAGTVMPGTTHGRLAQPVTLGHALLAHGWALARDLDRLRDWRARASVSPLGAGALATSTLGLDPVPVAAELGFDAVFPNSLDAVSDRDVVQELLAALAIAATHLSRLAADLVRWSDEALGWASLAEAYSTGSSMMPQKRNPDVAELARGKAGRVLGDLVAVSTALHGLPLGYHRDLQEDKEPALYATDVAEALVAAGTPFREAHRRVGELLKRLEADGRTLAELTDAEWAELGVPGGAALLDPDRAVRARGGPGGPAPERVLEQADALERLLEGG
jgi:argininosuccinate lyase